MVDGLLFNESRNTLTPERERRLREAVARRRKLAQERADLLDINLEQKSLDRANLPSKADIEAKRKADAEKLNKDRDERFNANRPFNKKANVDDLEREPKREILSKEELQAKLIKEALEADALELKKQTSLLQIIADKEGAVFV